MVHMLRCELPAELVRPVVDLTDESLTRAQDTLRSQHVVERVLCLLRERAAEVERDAKWIDEVTTMITYLRLAVKTSPIEDDPEYNIDDALLPSWRTTFDMYPR